MTDYGYTRSNGDILLVRSHLEDKFLVKVEHATGHAAGMTVPHEDAPAVALAILEAAGYDDPDNPKRVPSAVRKLKSHEANRKLQAEREAEDAKVEKFRRVIDGRGDLGPITDYDRRNYRAARKFFEES